METIRKVTKKIIKAPFDIVKGAFEGLEDGLGLKEKKKRK